MQGQLFEVRSDWTPPSYFPNLDGNFSIDLETRDPLLKTRGAGWAFNISSEIRGEIVGIGIGCEGGQWYFPFGHLEGGNLDRDHVFAWLKDQLEKRGDKVFHNALYDVGWLTAEGLTIREDEIHDTQYLCALFDENRRSYSLDSCMSDWIGETKDETLLRQVSRQYGIDPKSDMWKLHSKYVGAYGEQDAGGTWRLYERLANHSDYHRIHKVYGVERSLISPLIKMRRIGVPISLDRCEQLREIFDKKEREQLAFIKSQTNLMVRPGVPSKDAAAVLRHLGISVPKSAEGNDSVVASYLERLDHPVGKAIVYARKYRKAYKDFVESAILRTHVGGRVHATFHPMRSDEGGTVAGRFSSTNPNLQQVPARDPEIGPLVRSCYVPEEGEQLAPLDYSSQEPRWSLHFACEIGAPGANQAAQAFWDNPRTDLHRMTADLCQIKRKAAKSIFLGLCYGMGGAKLCRELGLPIDYWETPDGKVVEVAGAAGKELLRQFDQKVPWVKKLQQEAMRLAKGRGWVKTYLGRICHVPGEEHKSLNRVIQGSSADQIKLAMLETYRSESKLPLMLVHDESVYSVADEAQGRRIAHIMETVIPEAKVPFVVDCELVPNWGAVKK